MSTASEHDHRSVDLSFTSPAAAGTSVVVDPVTGLAHYATLTLYSSVQGGTGGTLDIIIQISMDGGTTWVDWLAFDQLAAGAAAVTKAKVFNRAEITSDLTAVGTGTSPALAAGAFLGGGWTDMMRVVAVAGVGMSAGAAQTIKAFFGE